MTSEQALREKLRKIEALFAGAKTDGERTAAGLAAERIRMQTLLIRVSESFVNTVLWPEFEQLSEALFTPTSPTSLTRSSARRFTPRCGKRKKKDSDALVES